VAETVPDIWPSFGVSLRAPSPAHESRSRPSGVRRERHAEPLPHVRPLACDESEREQGHAEKRRKSEQEQRGARALASGDGRFDGRGDG